MLKRKQPYLLSSTSRWIKENESFLLVEPHSRVTCFVEKKLQLFFLKYISIRAICIVLIRLISTVLYDMLWTHGGSNSWEKPTASGFKTEQCSFTILSIALHKKWIFPLRISSANVIKSAGDCGFGRIYWRNP